MSVVRELRAVSENIQDYDGPSLPHHRRTDRERAVLASANKQTPDPRATIDITFLLAGRNSRTEQRSRLLTALPMFLVVVRRPTA
jgi:hypothetical protein